MPGFTIRIPQLLPPEDLELRFEWDTLVRERCQINRRVAEVAGRRADFVEAVRERIDDIDARFDFDCPEIERRIGRMCTDLARAAIRLFDDYVVDKPRSRAELRAQPRLDEIAARMRTIGTLTEREYTVSDWSHQALWSTIEVACGEELDPT